MESSGILNGRVKIEAAFIALLAFSFLCFSSPFRYFWTDEAHSTITTFAIPLADYLVGQTGEGNTSPLFFLLLKALVYLQPTVAAWGLDSILWLRLSSILPMSVACGLVYLFSAARFGRSQRGFGALLSLLFLGSYSFLEFGWQARPYSLWILGSVIYYHLLINSALRNKPVGIISWFIVGLFLCTTISIGTLQLLAGGIVLLLSGKSLKELFKYASACAIPVSYAFFTKQGYPTVHFQWPGLFKLALLGAANVTWLLPAMGITIFLLRKHAKPLRFFLIYSASAILPITVIAATIWIQRSDAGFTVPNRYFLYFFPLFLLGLLYAMGEWLDGRPSLLTRGAFAAALIAFTLVGTPKRNLIGTLRAFSGETNFSRLAKETAKPVTASTACGCINSLAGEPRPTPDTWVPMLLAIRGENEGKKDCNQQSYWQITMANPQDPFATPLPSTAQAKSDDPWNLPKASNCR